jgi:hypothetical protein
LNQERRNNGISGRQFALPPESNQKIQQDLPAICASASLRFGEYDWSATVGLTPPSPEWSPGATFSLLVASLSFPLVRLQLS